ncbi:MAG: Hsp70 family protein [Actinocatenispora sp.]
MTVPDSLVLAVDFGSSNTVAVLRTADGRSRVLLFDSSPLLSSAVFASADGNLLVGRDAAHMARDEPTRFEPHPKRRIDDGAVLLGDRAVPVVDLVAAVLRRVADEARRVAGELPPVVLSHPVAWGAARRGVLSDAAARAGMTVTGLVAEPIAAASYFTAVLGGRLRSGQPLAVFDFGGGTLDVAVVRDTATGTEVVATGGLDSVGGVDVDAAIINHLAGPVQAAAPQVWARLSTPTGPTDLRDRGLVWQDARHAKEMLSRSSTATVHVPGLPSGTHVTRQEFETLAAPLVARAVAETVATLRRAGIHPADLAGVFLVGGSSRIPLVAQAIHRELGISPTVLEQPETAVAEGALYSPAAPRISPGLASALARMGPAVEVSPDLDRLKPGPRRRGLRPLIAAVSFLAAVGLVLGLLRPWEGDGGGHRGANAGQHSHTAADTPSATAAHPTEAADGHLSAATSDPPSPSSPSPEAVADPCPSVSEAKDALEHDPGVSQDLDLSVHDDPKCGQGYAYVPFTATSRSTGEVAQSGGALMQWTDNTWTDVVAGSDLCTPEADGGRPGWSRGRPDKALTLAGCHPADYSG